MTNATYSHDYDGTRFQLPITRDVEHRRQLIELGLRVTFALAQENESRHTARLAILAARTEKAS